MNSFKPQLLSTTTSCWYSKPQSTHQPTKANKSPAHRQPHPYARNAPNHSASSCTPKLMITASSLYLIRDARSLLLTIRKKTKLFHSADPVSCKCA